MIAYNKTWLTNLLLQDEVKKDAAQGYITPVELKTIEDKYPVGFYTPNLFVRIGLFILTCVIVSFAQGLLSLMAASGDLIESFGWFIFLGATAYIALELMVNGKFHYRSGVDDALLVIAGSQIAGGMAMVFYKSSQSGVDFFLVFSAIVLVLGVFLTLRFTDMLMSAFSCVAFLGLVFLLWLKVIPAGLATAPFAMMVLAAGTYWLAFTNHQKKRYVHYQNCLVVVQIISLLVLYAAGNYFVIQTLSTEMAGKTGPVPFGLVFWVWTVLLPFVYIYVGIYKKNTILLRTGLLLIAGAAITVRNYMHLMPIDRMLTLVGVVILVIVYGISKYLKTPQHGYTLAEPDEANLMDHLKVESLIAAGTFSHAPAAPAPESGTKFGGGSFGGGGSSGDF
jgi:hypothetical protein